MCKTDINSSRLIYYFQSESSFLSDITLGFRILSAGSSPNHPNWYPVPGAFAPVLCIWLCYFWQLQMALSVLEISVRAVCVRNLSYIFHWNLLKLEDCLLWSGYVQLNLDFQLGYFWSCFTSLTLFVDQASLWFVNRRWRQILLKLCSYM